MKQFLLTAIVSLFGCIGVAQTADGLVAYYPFNGNTLDESSFQNHAISDGAILTTDRFGNEDAAYAFDGLDDVIKAPDSDQLSFQNDFTISIWANTTEIKSQELIRKGITVNGPNTAPYSARLSSVGGTGFMAYTSNGLFNNVIQDGYDINRWLHYTFIRENDELKLFINGILRSTIAVSGTMLNETGELLIGSRLQLPSDTFKGSMDDVRLYNRALSHNEISDLFFENATPNLVASYPFSGDTSDTSPYANDALNVGAILDIDRFGIENNAYRFNGEDNLIEASDAPQLFLNEDFTISAWIRPESIKSQQIVLKGPVVNGPTAAPFGLSLSATGDYRFMVKTSVDTYIATDENYPINTWAFMTGVKVGNNIKLYVDGVLVAQESINGLLMDETAPMYIGSRTQSVGNTFDGKIDDVKIYNRALSDSEIADLASEISANVNVVKGAIQFDFDLNGCASEDFDASQIQVQLTEAGTILYTALTDEFGNYSFIVEEEGHLVVEVNEGSLPVGFVAIPSQETISFVGVGNQEVVDFCIEASEVYNDLKITLIPTTDARPGFDADYVLVYENVGTTLLSGTVTLLFDATRQEFIVANPEQMMIDGNFITWNFEDLEPFESSSIELQFTNFPPPTNENGDILVFEASITPVGDDLNPEDNVYVLEQEVINSQDPNDKWVNKGAAISISEVGGYLEYRVRFQNIGTASAINVYVEDVLSENLDWNTFRMLGASHDYELSIVEENKLRFTFEGIELPSVNSDPAGSNGYIAFQVKTKNNLQIGDFIENEANIFFDFNAPILTNKVRTTVVEILGLQENGLESSIRFFPNPVSDDLTISIPASFNFIKAEIYSLSGQKLLETSIKQIDFSNFSAGIYFVKVVSEQGSVTKKIVKQ